MNCASDNRLNGVSQKEFAAYMKATGGRKSYRIVDKKKSTLSADLFIFIADNLTLFKEKYPDIANQYKKAD